MSEPSIDAARLRGDCLISGASAALAFLEEQGVTGLACPNDAAQMATLLTGNAVTARLSRVGRENYAEQLAHVAATASFVLGQKNRDELVAEIARLAGIKRRKNSDDIAIIAHTAIDYKLAQSGKAWKNRQFWARDAKIVRNLLRAGIPFGQIAERLKLDGLSRWFQMDCGTPQERLTASSTVIPSTVSAINGPRIPWPESAPKISSLVPGQHIVLEFVVSSRRRAALKFTKGLVLPEHAADEKATAWFLLASGATKRFGAGQTGGLACEAASVLVGKESVAEDIDQSQLEARN